MKPFLYMYTMKPIKYVKCQKAQLTATKIILVNHDVNKLVDPITRIYRLVDFFVFWFRTLGGEGCIVSLEINEIWLSERNLHIIREKYINMYIVWCRWDIYTYLFYTYVICIWYSYTFRHWFHFTTFVILSLYSFHPPPLKGVFTDGTTLLSSNTYVLNFQNEIQ